ncbi:MAG: hypothetical protein PHP98_02450 [Kiritimatiellae bacterium]|nr:hypothetical protein [Kiritimatiellia bacterium]
MSVDAYQPVEQMLHDRIGLEPAALGPKAIECAVAERMRLLGINTTASYAELAAASGREFAALIELVVVPETWFFRDREPFVFLADFIRSERQRFRAQDTLRILSAPCATGEEPYSIAMTCLDCGLDRGRFIVDAMDINEKFLTKARAAVYGRNSFRGNGPAFRGQYFNPEEQAYALKPEVRACVRFFKANIIDAGSLPPCAPYDIVFCRNLLIYLHDQARLKIIAVIDRLLAPGGLLFIGHVEATPPLMQIFENVNHQGAFALRKKKQTSCPGWPDGGITAAPNAPPENEIVRPSGQSGPAPEPAPTPLPRPPPASVISENIERANRLADGGFLKEAEEICKEILKNDAPNARAHFLLGLIREAQENNRGAEECFHRAIYLDAGFTEAILHLAALKEKNGDNSAAVLLRRRAAAINARNVRKK